MNVLLIRVVNGLTRLSPTVTRFSQSIAFESSISVIPKEYTKDWKQSEEYTKDLPDPTLANPYNKPKKLCILCKYGIKVDYKNTQLLSQFVSPYTGRLYDKHITGLCEKQHQVLKQEYEKSVAYYLMSSDFREPKYAKDPKLFDPTRPQRPNPY
ncbi:28S ribosomal protein S18c, mitochondrial-like [Oppia nitens]|uniref:28S ribosomal protein S18c, mitochondrial-like n=1 Tax=Oppia nitens TaxID=1686743 RepID=UPI0023DA7794|nr:28S ribosomal protein S18c, mitochondrial-like [Oppia nitens]